ncbi:DM13 domain-containing protein [Microbacterium aoyamense]|uniref:DM13 domain-containing protein n=1 Tax=Microbacterium aoyamense TaxID=344166 RepID=UPI002005A320|nr:DM13 domain-containing protein [Microbacterium aoyamense]
MTEQTAQPRSGRPRRRIWPWIVGAIAAAAIAVGLFVFQPWLLFVDVRVDEAIPTATASADPAPDATASPGADPQASTTAAPTPPAPTGPVDLSTGVFVSHEHATTGSARVIQHPDGTRQLALENLDTSNGPDVHVWLSAGPVIEGFDGWFTAGGHPAVDLGPIKGNQGNQLYDIPADVDLAVFRAVDLWCVQFSVSFGAAALNPVG